VNSTPVTHKDLSNSHIRTFHARHGRLSDRRKYIAEHLVPALDVVNLERPLDLRSQLNREYVVIDFGCGMGDHTRNMSQEHPEWGILAMDVHTPGVCDVADIADSNGLGNIALHLGDGIDILRDHLADSSISEVHVLFPDPWPKARHNKRRVIQASFLEMVSRILVPGGHIHIVTDDDNYAEHVQQVLSQNTQLRQVDTGFVTPDTSYHRRAQRLGHTIHTCSGKLS
jgi:tRNA (guanine-N7-)-methyltransferase